MIVLLLLGAFVSVGLSDVVVETYGAKFVMELPTDTYSIEYSDLWPRVLWKRDDPSSSSQDTRLQVTHSSFIIRHVTQRDSGLYVMKDKYNRELKRRTLKVKVNEETYKLVSGEQLRFSFDLEPNICNVYFIPKFVDRGFETMIVRQGKLQTGLEKLNCSEFELLRPCGILIRDLLVSCKGNFEIRDNHGDKALVVELRKTVSETHRDPLYTAIGVTLGVVTLIGCCCVKCCKCLASSDKNISEPADTPEEYNYEPAGGGQPSQPLMPLHPVPAYTHSDPLVHNPPTVNAANAEVPADATALSLSDNEPRFELKGVHFPLSLPLTSDSVYQDVYISDKLNFK